MTGTENPQVENDDGVEAHSSGPSLRRIDDQGGDVAGYQRRVLLDENDEDDVAGHRMRAAEPGFISGALAPDDSLPSSKRGNESEGSGRQAQQACRPDPDGPRAVIDRYG